MINSRMAGIYAALGLDPKKHLPAAGVPARDIEQFTIWVNPLPPMPEGKRHKRSTHRVMARCRVCSQQLSAGRIHQHKCTKAVRKSATADNRAWRRERAMEAGMLHGVEAYNDEMGY